MLGVRGGEVFEGMARVPNVSSSGEVPERSDT